MTPSIPLRKAYGSAIWFIIATVVLFIVGSYFAVFSSYVRLSVLFWGAALVPCSLGAFIIAEKVHRWWVGVLAFLAGVVSCPLILCVFFAFGAAPTPPHRNDKALPISLGDKITYIPIPHGYFDASRSTKPGAKEQANSFFIGDANARLAFFLPNDESLWPSDSPPCAPHAYDVQILRTNISEDVAEGAFTKEKISIKRSFEPRYEAAVDSALKEGVESRTDGRASLSEAKHFPPHFEIEKAIAFSSLCKMSLTDNQGKSATIDLAATISFVELNGKILELHAYAPASDLERSRAECILWVSKALDMNTK